MTHFSSNGIMFQIQMFSNLFHLSQVQIAQKFSQPYKNISTKLLKMLLYLIITLIFMKKILPLPHKTLSKKVPEHVILISR